MTQFTMLDSVHLFQLTTSTSTAAHAADADDPHAWDMAMGDAVVVCRS